MTENDNRVVSDEIDLFEFVRIILKRKLFVLSVIMISVTGALFYFYFIRPDAPKSYFIKTVIQVKSLQINEMDDLFRDINKDLSGLRNQFISKATAWFKIKAYKTSLQKDIETGKLPTITMKNNSEFLTLEMIYHDPEEGKRLLTKIVNNFISKEMGYTYINDLKKIFDKHIKLVRQKLHNFSRKTTVMNDLVASYRFQIETLHGRIENFKVQLNELDALKSDMISTHGEDPVIITGLIDDHKDTLEKTINHLKQGQIQAASSVRFINLELDEIQTKHTQQQLKIEILNKESGESDSPFTTRDAYFEDRPPRKRYSNIQITGIVGVLAAFLGVVIAFILGINERRKDVPR